MQSVRKMIRQHERSKHFSLFDFKNTRKMDKKKTALSPKEIRGLSTLKEVVNEAEERARMIKMEKKVMRRNQDQTRTSQKEEDDRSRNKVKEWLEVIERREREVVKRQQRRKEEGEEKETEEKSGIG